MKIKTMTASFGKLDRQTLDLGSGLNIIEAHNEGGKSTWAGFLKAMLYGIDTRDRDKKGHLADKNRYQPWSGAPMEGEITLEWQGRDITIRRGKKGNSAFGSFSAVYTGTEEPVLGMTGDNCGELLTGVGRDVFERSAFIGQSGVTINSAPELEKRIAALVSSGEEDVSYSQAEACLKEWANRRKVNKTVGLIPKLEQELDQNRRTMNHLEQVTAAIAQCEGEKATLSATKKELEDELYIHKRLQQRELNRRFAQAQEEHNTALGALEALEKEQARFGELPEKEVLRKYQGELQYLKVLTDEIKQGEVALKEAEEAYVQANIAIQDEYFNSLTAEEARHKAGDEVRQHQELLTKAAKKGKLVLACQIAGLVLGGGVIAASAAGLVPPEWNLPQYLPYAIGAGAYLVFAITSAIFIGGKSKCKKSAAAILARYNADFPEKITTLAEDYAARWQVSEEKAQEMKSIHGALNDRKARRENGRNDLMDFVHTFAPEVKDLFGASAALSRALGLEDRMRECKDKEALTRRRMDDLAAQGGQPFDTLELLHTPERSLEETKADLEAVNRELRQVGRALDMSLGEQKAIGDPAALCARQEGLQQQLDRRNQEYQALTIAMEALKGANVHLQERFSPELNRLAGQWLGKLTGGKYSSVSLARDLEASATESGGLLPRKALALSKGTVDQLYLAVRLAVCQLCLPQQEPAPLVLDDALVAFDDVRMAKALDCLAELGKRQQILLFTCQSREGRALVNNSQVRQICLTEK